ncbi:MAG: 3-deoxy-manno-octulosonate cytidylyltransferase [Alphaproteobacteria bacterium]|nr:3-deoxy-manno-octulosonate cytidylyltransferase [Alphaproteobacteria bacterium]MBQ8346992.1 3-deoxy-manno-octulosonate cytidylyltransferase [Alphaproteobacteria bacterium]
MSKVITMIPVRLAATRLPNKPLLDINGKTLIQRVYENVKAAIDGDVCIACGDEKIMEEAKKFGAQCVLTDPNLPSGTDRIATALKQIDPDGTKYDVAVNFQGDNINVDPAINNRLIKIIEETNCDIATCGMVFKTLKDAENPNNVKIVMGLEKGETQGRAVYFTRALAPYIRDPDTCAYQDYYHHIGIYVFKTDVLKKFLNMKEAVLEKREKLEQLRFLQNGYHMQALIVDKIKLNEAAPADINTVEELEEFRKLGI